MSSPKFLDLSKTTFTITPDGKYCSFVVATVNGKTLAAASPKCYKISSDTYQDRVFCIGNSIAEAYKFYTEGTGTISVTDDTKQQVYNSIVQQFLPTIQKWNMCDADKFVTAYNNAVNSIPVINVQVSSLLKQHINDVGAALKANGCGSSSGGSAARPWYFWLLLVLGILLVLAVVWGGWNWYQKSKNSSSSSSSTRRSSKRRA